MSTVAPLRGHPAPHSACNNSYYGTTKGSPSLPSATVSVATLASGRTASTGPATHNTLKVSDGSKSSTLDASVSAATHSSSPVCSVPDTCDLSVTGGSVAVHSTVVTAHRCSSNGSLMEYVPPKTSATRSLTLPVVSITTLTALVSGNSPCIASLITICMATLL